MIRSKSINGEGAALGEKLSIDSKNKEVYGRKFEPIRLLPPQPFIDNTPFTITPIGNKPLFPLIARVISINGVSRTIKTCDSSNSQQHWKFSKEALGIALNGGDYVCIQDVRGKIEMFRFQRNI